MKHICESLPQDIGELFAFENFVCDCGKDHESFPHKTFMDSLVFTKKSVMNSNERAHSKKLIKGYMYLVEKIENLFKSGVGSMEKFENFNNIAEKQLVLIRDIRDFRKSMFEKYC